MVLKEKREKKLNGSLNFQIFNFSSKLVEELMFLIASVVEGEQVPGEVGAAGHSRQQYVAGQLAGQGGDGWCAGL